MFLPVRGFGGGEAVTATLQDQIWHKLGDGVPNLRLQGLGQLVADLSTMLYLGPRSRRESIGSKNSGTDSKCLWLGLGVAHHIDVFPLGEEDVVGGASHVLLEEGDLASCYL